MVALPVHYCKVAKTSVFKPLQTIDRLVRELIHWTEGEGGGKGGI